MDYETIDKDMSSWIITCKRLTTRLYLTDDGLGTDCLRYAKRYRWQDEAEQAAFEASEEYAWLGFGWQAMSVPEAMTKK